MKPRDSSDSSGVLSPLRLLLPLAVIVLFFLLNLIVLPLPIIGAVKPPLMIMVLYYWAIHRPTLVPPWLCFILGVATDILTMLPPGTNAMLFVIIQWVGREQRRFLIAQPYVTIWAVFGLILTAGSFTQWALYGMTSEHVTPIAPIIAQIAVGIFLFPFVTMLLVAVHRLMPQAKADYL